MINKEIDKNAKNIDDWYTNKKAQNDSDDWYENPQ
jgi:hypothetical protein